MSSGAGSRRMLRTKRIVLLMSISILAGALYLTRMIALQGPSFSPAATSELAMKAVRQRHAGIVLDTGRGRIVDRNGEIIAGEQIYALAAFPVPKEQRGTEEQLRRLAVAIGEEPARLAAWLHGLQEPAIWSEHQAHDTELRARAVKPGMAEVIQESGVAGVYVVPYTVRYSERHPAAHAIGYISQHPEQLAALYASELARGSLKLSEQVGGSGIERSLDRILRGAGPTIAYYASMQNSDAALQDRGLRITRPANPYYPVTVTTTLHLKLERALEDYAEEAGLQKGAIVVLDAGNGDIAAMVSRPNYDPSHIEQLSDTANRALLATAPGSIFKLVTEAAALEAGKGEPGEKFYCDGEHEAHGLSCWLEGGHGWLTLEQALAQSCNVAFAQLAERLTPEELLQTADRLGMARPIGWTHETAGLGQALRPLGEEESGRIFIGHPTARNRALLAQSGIGQRDVAVTPLQAANLVVTLLHGGKVHAPRLVKEVRYANGQLMTRLPVHGAPSHYGPISRLTATALLRGMERVVAEGTGQPLKQAIWRLAGKSGTAQALSGGKPVNHQWFIGYGPLESPRYAVAIVAEDRPVDSVNQATRLFAGVMDIIAAHDKSSSTVQ